MKKSPSLNQDELIELLYQALETEKSGINVYEAALHCAVNPELKEEWQDYLKQAQNREKILLEVFERLDMDLNAGWLGRSVVRHAGEMLVAAMEMVLVTGKAGEAQIVAAECVAETETKARLNWELIGEAGRSIKGERGEVLKEAHELAEEEKDKHLYQTMGWARHFGLNL